MYADDLKIFNDITDISDCLVLQNDLILIENWCVENKLSLNIEKCNVVTYSKRQTIVLHNYRLLGVKLSRQSIFRDLGVIFDHQLTFSDHVASITTSAFRALGFVIRNTTDMRNINTVQILYNTLVRSKLEYASPVWNPHYYIHIHSIENIQRHFLKYLSYTVDHTYPPIGIDNNLLLNRFSYTSLENRRHLHGIIFLYKIVNAIIDCPILLQQIRFQVPSISTRFSSLFYLKTARTNVLYTLLYM